jgi:hypothetical protein
LYRKRKIGWSTLLKTTIKIKKSQRSNCC